MKYITLPLKLALEARENGGEGEGKGRGRDGQVGMSCRREGREVRGLGLHIHR